MQQTMSLRWIRRINETRETSTHKRTRTKLRIAAEKGILLVRRVRSDSTTNARKKRLDQTSRYEVNENNICQHLQCVDFRCCFYLGLDVDSVENGSDFRMLNRV